MARNSFENDQEQSQSPWGDSREFYDARRNEYHRPPPPRHADEVRRLLAQRNRDEMRINEQQGRLWIPSGGDNLEDDYDRAVRYGDEDYDTEDYYREFIDGDTWHRMYWYSYSPETMVPSGSQALEAEHYARRRARNLERDWRRRHGPAYRGRGPKGFQRNDEVILEDVCERLTMDERIDPSDVTVSVDDGQVYLRGSVLDRRAKLLLEDIAASVPGVVDVLNFVKFR